MQKIILIFLGLAFALTAFAPSSNFKVTGKITDASGNPIPFATVKIKGGNTGTNANALGQFSIKVNDGDVLEIQAAGYNTGSVKVSTNMPAINIVLTASSRNLEEVVVKATGVRRQPKELGYSTTKISADQLNQAYIPSLSTGLAGKVSGLQITLVNGNTLNSTRDKKDFDREGYDNIVENSFHKVTDNPLSTFSIDVDAASYSNMRRFLNAGELPPAGAIRIEEMVNYFHYEYPQPKDGSPFSVNTEISECPWNRSHRLALIGLQGKIIPAENLPPSNIVFLIDVSGSMYSADKLPLLKQSLKLLVDQLREKDNVSLCVYAGNAGLVLPSTNGSQKQKIKDAIDALESGGSTAGGAGIKLAYKVAADNFIKGGNNRIILCTDGDFNVGASSDDELERMVEKERENGVYLTVLGFGTGNYQDAKMQKLADKGNGNHAYIDQLSEAKKVLVSEFGGTLFTIAKDVKLQIEFNPSRVQGYRLIGYENRMLNKEDFNDDKKDAGELGSGHTVTALYEIIPVGINSDFLKNTDTLRYMKEEKFSASAFSDELMTVKLRYKQPDGNISKLLSVNVADSKTALNSSSTNYRFAAAVAEFGMLLRNSSFKQHASYNNVINLAGDAVGADREGYRKEFVKLVEKAWLLKKGKAVNKVEEEEDDAVTSFR